VWLRRSAIRPIPRYARVPESTLAALEATFSAADERARQLARAGHERLKSEQPALAEYLADSWSPSLDETALALGQMLAVAVFLAFEAFSPSALEPLSAELLGAARLGLDADEELRRSDPTDPLDSEDIVAIEQPALVAFINDHLGRTLERHADSVDVDDVALVFRTLLIEIIALSHVVARPPGYPVALDEPLT
jgi:hypothetical protein